MTDDQYEKPELKKIVIVGAHPLDSMTLHKLIKLDAERRAINCPPHTLVFSDTATLKSELQLDTENLSEGIEDAVRDLKLWDLL